ncbi:uncharacterized protein LOC111322195 [Stylophora pistillata]|uniref:Uncharacterized protein n=1 Tax=Stylophora pistillata TaxID=50429 RepID=A0A2B4SL02_STYPI|nr:uncharacterized protein LOC111322195 [Stylophora pistillata]PFX31354.1 hypothetical protein AWC38_SpisGene3817 [Stylophora pistillata]
MKVICAGLSKTGTTSMATALRILGLAVYDWSEHCTIHVDEWLNILHRGKIPDFSAMYNNVDAVTDLPAAIWFQEILEVFPDAKVILTVRDNEDVWVRSWSKQQEVENNLNGCWFPTRILERQWLYHKYYALADATNSAAFGSLNPKSVVLFKKKYREHNERVKVVVRKENLLIFNVKQGWGPLCEFLKCQIPTQEPFPRINVALSNTFEKMAKRQQEAKEGIESISESYLLISYFQLDFCHD